MTYPLSILIIDDMPEKCRAIKETMLYGYDCNVDCSLTYEDAVGKLCSNRYDIIVSDYKLVNDSTILPEGCEHGNGKMLRDSHLRHHPECRFILYSAQPEVINDKETKIVCVDFKDLKSYLISAIYFSQQPKNNSEKPQDNTEPVEMTQRTKANVLRFVPIVVIAAGLVGTFSVAQYRTDENDASICKNFNEDKQFRAEYQKKEVELAAKLSELQTTQKNMMIILNDIKYEIKKGNR